VIVLALGRGVYLRAYPDEARVETLFPDGRLVPGTREPTPENCAEAASQGYTPDADGCWRSLVEHEAMHNIVAPDLWPDGISAALAHEAGLPRTYRARLHEEAVVLSFQAWSNDLPIEPALRQYKSCLSRWIMGLGAVRRAMGWAPAEAA